MSDPAKVRKHAERVRELVASAVRTQIKDPRLGMVTITDARITADLREATVFYTVLGDVEEQQSTAAALESAKGMLRGPIGRALGLRHSPSLAFVMDNVQETVKHIDDLLAEAKLADAKVHEIAERASYAGDPQPYKLDEDDADEAGDDEEDEPARAAGAGR